MHIIPQLRKLERKYRDSLVVIGVHSSKFPNERDTGNIRSAILRYGVEHPVVNDREMRVGMEYGFRSWPTLMFIDPEGRVFAVHEGEFPYDQMDALIGDMIREYDQAGLLDHRPLPYQLEAERMAVLPLLFPGKIEADVA
ncbi:MAG TPA: alkyl hydroperoxide reductase, partial [Dehalococcoidia bacterium]|nr:alkyl hydroperoxide reductase [Dehalococcoidia bacterium]